MCASLAFAPGAARGGVPPGLTLSPSRAEGTIAKGISVGPFGFTNTSSRPYRVTVLPVLLSQDRQGGVHVKDDQAGLAQARRYLSPDTGKFVLAPDGHRDVSGTVKSVPKEGSLYGGLLFSAEPKHTGTGISQTLQLNASVLLDPPDSERRIAVGAGEVAATQDGNHPIQIGVATTNRGNVYAPADGSIRIVGPKGKDEGTVELKGQRILPGATVDLAGSVAKRLPVGTYRLQATVTMEGQTDHSTGRMVLTAPGQLEFRDAALSDFPAPQAEEGKPVDFSATYENTGNVDFAPQAEVKVKPVRHGNVQAPASTQRLDVEETSPGDEGQISGSVELPGQAKAYELELRIFDGKRPLDSRSVAVTPRPGVGFGKRITDWITGNAVWLVAALVALLIAIALAGLYYARRQREGITRTSRTPPTPPPAPARIDPHPFETPPSPAGNGAPSGADGARISLSAATYDELRALGLSMTQANRVLRYRERHGPFSSVEDLREVGGFPQQLLAEVMRRAKA